MNTFVNIQMKKYKFKIEKSKLYKLIYNSNKINVCHDLRQCKTDLNRTQGTLNLYYKYKLKNISLNTFIEELHSHSDIVLYNTLNFLPQQIFYIFHKIILKKYPGFVVTETDTFMNIDKKKILRELHGTIIKLPKNGIIQDNDKLYRKYCHFILKLYHSSNTVSIQLKVFDS